jgi:hypothetical protein
VEEAKALEEQTKSELEKTRTANNASILRLEQDIAEAKSAAERDSAGLEHLKASCNKAIQDAQNEGERKVKALQEDLVAARAEVEKAKGDGEKFRKEVEHSWRQEQQTRDQVAAESKRKLSEVEDERDEAQADVKRIRTESSAEIESSRKAYEEQLAELRERVETAEAKLKASEATRRRADVDSQEGITPTGSFKQPEPQKPRKKVDRSSNSVVEVGGIPVPETLRPTSRLTASAGSDLTAMGRIVEQSQSQSRPFGVQVTNSLAQRQLDDIDPILIIKGSQFDPLPEVVEETQFDDGIVSQYYDAMSTQNAGTFGILPGTGSVEEPSQAFEVKSPTSFQPVRREQDILNRFGSPQLLPDFPIHEDAPEEEDEDSNLADFAPHMALRDTLSWSQADKDKYTFRKAHPQPNSASKRVEPVGALSQPTRRVLPLTESSFGSSQLRAQTPLPRKETGGTGKEKTRSIWDVESSSPGFMEDSQAPKRRKTTYKTAPSSGGKRRSSAPKQVKSSDPRLAARRPSASQNVNSQASVSQGYEKERKKRVGGEVTATGSERTPTYSSSQSSLHSSQFFPTMPAGPRDSGYGASNSRPGSNMRRLGGGSSRSVRPSQKMSRRECM